MTTETYTVTGMTCGHCVSSVTEEVSELPGVSDVQVDLDSGRGHRHRRRPGRRRQGPRRRRGGRLRARRLAPRHARRTEQGATVQPVATLGAYAGALALVFGARRRRQRRRAVGTAGTGTPPRTAPRATTTAASDDAATQHRAGADVAPGGLAVAEDGYALASTARPRRRAARPARPSRSTGPDGEPVLDYDPQHDKDLHLIVVRRDLTGYQHLHPSPRRARAPGRSPLTSRRARTRCSPTSPPPAGEPGSRSPPTSPAPGTYTPQPLPAPARPRTVDGYDVALDGDARRRDQQPAHPHRHPRRRAGHRPRALPRRVRPPRRAARRRPRVPARPPGATTARTPGPAITFTPTSRARRRTGCSSTSSTTAPSGPQSSPPRRPREPVHPSTCRRRARDQRHDVRVVREPDRAQAQQARRRHRDRQLRDGEGEGRLPRGVRATTCSSRRGGRLHRAPSRSARRHDGRPARARRRRRARPRGRSCGTGSVVTACSRSPSSPCRWSPRCSSGLAVARARLAAPVVVWGAWPFHRAAWKNLRNGAATMDTLISVGTLAALAWSLYALFSGTAGSSA